MSAFDTSAMLRWRIDPLAFIECCLFDPETNQPFVLSDAERWFLKFAFQLNEKGRLRFPELVFGAIKKSGKSTLAALFIITLLLLFGGRYAEAYVCANSFEQAQSRVFQMCARIVEASPTLAREARVTQDRIVFKHFCDATILAIASGAANNAGGSPTIVSFDELHGAVSENDCRFFEEMAITPTRQISCRLTTTYAGYSGESVLLENLYRRGMALPEIGHGLRGRDGDMLFVWHTEPIAVWQTDEWLEQMKQSNRPSQFRRMYQNEWVSGKENFLGDMAAWDDIVDVTLNPVVSDPTLPVWIGIDASTKRDSTAVAVTSFNRQTQQVHLVAHKIFQPTSNQPIDFDVVEATLLDYSKRFSIRKILYDPNQMVAVAQRLAARGLPIVEYAQTPNNLTLAAQNLFELITGHGIAVYPDPQLRLAVSCAVAVESPRGWKLDKTKQSDRIDVVIALMMSALAAVRGQGESNFEQDYSKWVDPALGSLKDPEAAARAWAVSRYANYIYSFAPNYGNRWR